MVCAVVLMVVCDTVLALASNSDLWAQDTYWLPWAADCLAFELPQEVTRCLNVTLLLLEQ